MQRFPVHKLFCLHGCCRINDCSDDALSLIRSHPHCILYTSIILSFDLFDTCSHLFFTAVTAKCYQVRINSPDIICSLRKVLSHDARKYIYPLVTCLIATSAVDHRQSVDIAYCHSNRKRKMVHFFHGKSLKAIPFLKSCKHIRLQRYIRKYKHLAKSAAFLVVKPSDITP